MSTLYLTIDANVYDKRWLHRLANRLGAELEPTLGKLIRLFTFALNNHEDGILRDHDAEDLARIMCWRGEDVEKLWAACESAGIIRGIPAGDGFEIVVWSEVAGRYMEYRQKKAELKAAERARKKGAPEDGADTASQQNVAGVSPASRFDVAPKRESKSYTESNHPGEIPPTPGESPAHEARVPDAQTLAEVDLGQGDLSTVVGVVKLPGKPPRAENSREKLAREILEWRALVLQMDAEKSWLPGEREELSYGCVGGRTKTLADVNSGSNLDRLLRYMSFPPEVRQRAIDYTSTAKRWKAQWVVKALHYCESLYPAELQEESGAVAPRGSITPIKSAAGSRQEDALAAFMANTDRLEDAQ